MAGGSSFSGLAVKYSSSGNLEWSHTYNSPLSSVDGFTSVKQTKNGGYILAGSYFEGSNTSLTNAWLIQINSTGDSLWEHTYGSMGVVEVARDIVQITDGSYTIGGSKATSSRPFGDSWIFNVDANGDLQWETMNTTSPGSEIHSIKQTSDGGYLAAGSSYNNSNWDMMVYKTDANGNLQWQKNINTNVEENGLSVALTTDGGCVAAGYAYVTNYTDFLIAKLELPRVSISSNGGTIICGSGSKTFTASAGGSNYQWSTGATTQAITVNSTGTYSVTVDHCYTASETLTVLPSTLLQADPITGTMNVCSYQTYQYTTHPLAGATDYIWIIPAGMTLVDDGLNNPTDGIASNTITVTIKTSGALGLSVKAHNVCGVTGPASATFTPVRVTLVPATPGNISAANASVCPGTTAAYTVPAAARANSYNWIISGAASILSGQGTTTVTVLFDNAFNGGTLQVNGSNCVGPGAYNAGKVISKQTAPNPPLTISASSTKVCPLTSANYSVQQVSTATAYNWVAPAGATVDSGQGTRGVRILFDNTFTGGEVKVSASNCVGTSAFGSPLAISLPTAPSAPGNISGSSFTVCPLSSATYSVGPVTNAISYNWVAPTGATVDSGQGTRGVRISFDNTFNGGNLQVSATNCGGTSALSSPKAVSKQAVPAKPGTITGNTLVCGLSSANYSLANPVTNAISYNWIAPAGATVDSGQGTRGVKITFTGAFVGGGVQVSAIGCSGAGPLSNPLNVLPMTLPATPTIAHPTLLVCPNGTYSYTAISTNANYLKWTLPANTRIVATTNDSATIMIEVLPGFTVGTVSVVGVNCSGQSATPKNMVLSITPATPGAITGATSGVCDSTTSMTYYIAAMSGIANYKWTISAGTIQQSGTNTYIGTNIYIVADFPASFSSITVSVQALSNCNTPSIAKTVTVKQVPAALSAISGNNPVCPSTLNTYTVSTTTSGATYNWTIPTGFLYQSGQGTGSLVVKSQNSAGVFKVSASNACGSTAVVQKNITIQTSGCSSAKTDETTDVTEIVSNEGTATMKLYPNPSNGDFFIELSGIDETEPLQFDLYDINGQSVYRISKLMLNNDAPFMIESTKVLAKGLYFIRVSNQNINFEKKVLIAK